MEASFTYRCGTDECVLIFLFAAVAWSPCAMWAVQLRGHCCTHRSVIGECRHCCGCAWSPGSSTCGGAVTTSALEVEHWSGRRPDALFSWKASVIHYCKHLRNKTRVKGLRLLFYLNVEIEIYIIFIFTSSYENIMCSCGLGVDTSSV